LLLAVLLTQQRGAYLSATVATLFFFFHSNISIRYLLVAIIIFFLGATFLIRSDKDIIESLVDYTANRISEDLIGGDAYSERAVSYRKALTLQGEFPFGMGIGATTSAADASGANPGGQVVDANYMRILVDLGAIGLYLFLAVLTFGARSVIVRHRSKAFIVILFIYAFQATGTNIFDSYYVTHLFWLFLGIIDTPLSRV
jgi:cell division protein FtsW (lipid II flippase)